MTDHSKPGGPYLVKALNMVEAVALCNITGAEGISTPRNEDTSCRENTAQNANLRASQKLPTPRIAERSEARGGAWLPATKDANKKAHSHETNDAQACSTCQHTLHIASSSASHPQLS